MGRPRKYDWEDKRDICHKLWVEDKLTGPQIVTWFAKHFNLPESELPRSNQFISKFKTWGFPYRRGRMEAEKEARLVARCRELFNQNFAAQDIQKTLLEEGWEEMDDYHFRVFRKKHGMMKRNLGGYKPLPAKKRKQAGDVVEAEGDQEAEEDDVGEAMEDQREIATLPPEEAARRVQRMAELQMQSDEQLRARKRRRRIRGYGHMGPDDQSLPPRYGSETSLDECKAFLNLSNDLYVQIRSQYENICGDMGIIKMSLCVEGQWQASKDRLIRENMHLSSMLHPLQSDLDKRLNALNCICSDVTKRMRNEGKAMSIADASNILGLDPYASKEVRRIFYSILEADQFTTIIACGKDHVDELRERWYAQSDILQQAVASGDAEKMRAIDLLCKDARKRFCDDRTRKDPGKKRWHKGEHYGPGPGPAQTSTRSQRGKKLRPTTFQANTAAPQPTPAPTRTAIRGSIRIPVNVPSWEGHELPEFRMSTMTDVIPPINFDLDPLLSATHGPPWPPPQAVQSSPHPPASTSSSIPAYFRLAPTSQITGNHPRMWLGKLTTGANLESLYKAATLKTSGTARVRKVNGVVKNADGSEDSWLIESEDELGVYLQEAGEKATFVVVLEGGYA